SAFSLRPALIAPWPNEATTNGCNSPKGQLFDPFSAPLICSRPSTASCAGWCWGGGAIVGSAVRLAVGGVRGERLWLRSGFRGLAADRGAGARREPCPGVGVVRGGSGGGRADRAAARPVGRVPPQATGADHHGSDPVRGDGDDPDRVRPA